MKYADRHAVLLLPAMFCLVLGAPVSAQSAAKHMALGIKESDARNPLGALTHYKTVLAGDSQNYEALWRASLAELELGEYSSSSDQGPMYEAAERHARHAVRVNAADIEGHFVLALVLGQITRVMPVVKQSKYAVETHDEALACLRIDAKYPGCLHVMGEWHAEVMRLGGFIRTVDQQLPGGTMFGEASWDEAQHNLEAAVTNEPRRIVHRLDLARVYVDRGMKAEAQAAFQAVVDGELVDYNDLHYKAAATRALKELPASKATP